MYICIYVYIHIYICTHTHTHTTLTCNSSGTCKGKISLHFTWELILTGQHTDCLKRVKQYRDLLIMCILPPKDHGCVTLAVGASARRMKSLLMPGIGLKE